MIKTQQCSACRDELTQDQFSPSNWGKIGQVCRTCDRLHRIAHQTSITFSKGQLISTWRRQHGRCLGCFREIFINKKLSELRELKKLLGYDPTACVDHNHETGVIRGLLCRSCNLALGNIHEDRQTLRRLLAYLDRDPEKIHLYVIGSLRNPNVPAVANRLRAAGYDVFDEWHAAGPEADDFWQHYCKARGFTFADALRGRTAQNTFMFDRAYLDLADGAVMVAPAGKSAHLELGYIRGCGKPCFILKGPEDEERYEIMPNVATCVCEDEDRLLTVLKETFVI